MSIRPAARIRGFRKTLIRRIFEAAPQGAINLGLGEPPGPTPEGVSAGGLKAVADGNTGYSPTAGRQDLREAIAAACPGQAAADEVVVTAGSQEALFATLMLFVEPGGEVLVPDPGYPAYPNIVELLGGKAVRYRLDRSRGYRLQASDLLDRINPATVAVILNGPSNPTGAVDEPEELQRLTAGLEELSVPFLSDEIYSGLSWEQTVFSPREARPSGGIVVSGLSKSHAMTGWRIGWAVAPPELVGPLTALHQHMVTCAPSPSQGAALSALGEEGMAEAATLRARLLRRRDAMDLELRSVPGIRYGLPDGGFYYFVQVDGCEDSERLAFSILEKEQVITVPGAAFGPGGEGCLRLSFAAAEEEIVSGVAGIRRVLDR